MNKNNTFVERSGFCPVCRRAGGEYEKTLAKKEE